MTLAPQATEHEAVVHGAVAQLVDGRDPYEAQHILGVAIVAMGDRAADIARSRKLHEELNAFFTLVTRAFQGDPEPNMLSGFQQTLLTEATRLAARLTDPDHNNNAFWRSVVQTLRAECLHLLGETERAHAIALSAQIALGHVAANPVVDTCGAYVTQLIAGGHPPVTTVSYLDYLHEMLNQA